MCSGVPFISQGLSLRLMGPKKYTSLTYLPYELDAPTETEKRQAIHRSPQRPFKHLSVLGTVIKPAAKVVIHAKGKQWLKVAAGR